MPSNTKYLNLGGHCFDIPMVLPGEAGEGAAAGAGVGAAAGLGAGLGG